ncbi:hypothetical protein FRC02_002161 [Tulasnella sp. 418]|nr:hypothetical protein FRC02_002161 [Tulasnella sp. 418]
MTRKAIKLKVPKVYSKSFFNFCKTPIACRGPPPPSSFIRSFSFLPSLRRTYQRQVPTHISSISRINEDFVRRSARCPTPVANAHCHIPLLPRRSAAHIMLARLSFLLHRNQDRSLHIFPHLEDPSIPRLLFFLSIFRSICATLVVFTPLTNHWPSSSSLLATSSPSLFHQLHSPMFGRVTIERHSIVSEFCYGRTDARVVAIEGLHR